MNLWRWLLREVFRVEGIHLRGRRALERWRIDEAVREHSWRYWQQVRRHRGRLRVLDSHAEMLRQVRE